MPCVLLPVFHHAFEGEFARALHQHHGIGQLLCIDGLQHGLRIGQVDRARGKEVALCGELRADGDQAVHACAFEQCGHAAVEIGRGAPALADVAQHHHARAILCEGVQVVERDAQRGQVVAVTVVDQRTTMDPIERAHAHGHRPQVVHAPGDPLRIVAQVKQQRDAMQGVLHRGGIVERQRHGETTMVVQEMEPHAAGMPLFLREVHERALFARPIQMDAAAIDAVDDGFAHRGVVAAVHHGARFAEELHLFTGLLPVAGEILAVRWADVGEHADVRPDDRAQRLHLAGFADPRLEKRQRMLGRQFPHAQRHTQAAVP